MNETIRLEEITNWIASRTETNGETTGLVSFYWVTVMRYRHKMTYWLLWDTSKICATLSKPWNIHIDNDDPGRIIQNKVFFSITWSIVSSSSSVLIITLLCKQTLTDEKQCWCLVIERSYSKFWHIMKFFCTLSYIMLSCGIIVL